MSRVNGLIWKRTMRDPDGDSNWGPGVHAPPAEQMKGLQGSIDQ